MGKTITLRLEDNIYQILKNAAEAEKRTISNFIEIAALSYLQTESFLADEEMADILKNHELIDHLQQALHDVKTGNYTIVE